MDVEKTKQFLHDKSKSFEKLEEKLSYLASEARYIRQRYQDCEWDVVDLLMYEKDTEKYKRTLEYIEKSMVSLPKREQDFSDIFNSEFGK